MKSKLISQNIIDKQATKVLSLVAGYTFAYPQGVYAQTSAFHNGRENWACVRVVKSANRSEQLVVIFGEARNSDSIHVASWTMRNTFGAPTLADYTEDAYRNGRTGFECGAYDKAAAHAVKLISQFIGV